MIKEPSAPLYNLYNMELTFIFDVTIMITSGG